MEVIPYYLSTSFCQTMRIVFWLSSCVIEKQVVSDYFGITRALEHEISRADLKQFVVHR